jgi:hypothetical protein
MLKSIIRLLTKNYGIIINVDNSVISNDGEHITIKIPVESFDKFNNEIINESETTKHETSMGLLLGKSELEFVKGQKGFKIKKLC